MDVISYRASKRMLIQAPKRNKKPPLYIAYGWNSKRNQLALLRYKDNHVCSFDPCRGGAIACGPKQQMERWLFFSTLFFRGWNHHTFSSRKYSKWQSNVWLKSWKTYIFPKIAWNHFCECLRSVIQFGLPLLASLQVPKIFSCQFWLFYTRVTSYNSYFQQSVTIIYIELLYMTSKPYTFIWFLSVSSILNSTWL